MKHNWQITLTLLAMFLITQLIGLAVINAYTPIKETKIINGTEQNVTVNPLPYGMQPPELEKQEDFWTIFPSIIIAFVIAIALVFILSKFEISSILRYWFFIVVILALGITLNALFLKLDIFSRQVNIFGGFPLAWLIAGLVALPLAFFKIFKRNLFVHNITELMVYPGIAAVFVPILNVWTIVVLLLAISAYDMWAVWHTGFMQKMAKFQINKMKIFAGFFVPYADKKTKKKIKDIKTKYKGKKIPEKEIKKKKLSVSLAILGGGDVIFPIIAAGIFLRTYGLIPALTVTLFSLIALFSLFVAAKKGKFYPAMPFLTTGIFIGMLVGRLLFYL
jgi:presenilin-like A22 family membrane protease